MKLMPMLIGIDGGATKVNAWEIFYTKANSTFSLGELNSTKSYSEIKGYISDFKPVNLNIQLKERDSAIHITADEKRQAAVYVETCALAVHELAKKRGNSNVLLGLGMPGLKTKNKRGIAVVANGPRMTDYSEKLEERLKSLNITLVSNIAHLGSDADYCGMGENYSKDGLFRGSRNAYYLGGGTGVADAMKLEGELVSFDSAKEWIAKTWELKTEEGVSLERVTSVSGIQQMYAENSCKTVEELNAAGIYPMQISEMAKRGSEAALQTFREVSRNLASLLFERIVTLNRGWQNPFDFVNPKHPGLDVNHRYRGEVFDTIVIGQRLGDLFDDEKAGKEIVKEPVLNQLKELIQSSEILPEHVKSHYSHPEQFVKTSKLREAPALGAGIDAFFNL